MTDLCVVIPVFNDPAGIRDTVQSLPDPSPRVHIIDNASTDDTPDIIGVLAAQRSHVTALSETHVQSSYAARNTGIRHTDTDVLAFLDADMRVSEDYFNHALAHLHDHNLDYFGCHVDLTIPDNQQTLTARYNAHTGFPIKQYLNRHRYAPTCALFVRREVFENVGLFDPRLISGGDMEFGNRVDTAGYDMGYCADAVAYHPVRSSFRSLYAKNVRVGRGHGQLQRYYPERYGTPPIPPRHPQIDTEMPDLSRSDRLAFGSLSAAMTAARASGYARELLSPSDTGANVDGPPEL